MQFQPGHNAVWMKVMLAGKSLDLFTSLELLHTYCALKQFVNLLLDNLDSGNLLNLVFC